MRFLATRKDGGLESRVTGFFLIEIKCLFSIVLLRFSDGSRDAFHTHAFNALSWVLRGRLTERHLSGREVGYGPSVRPVFTYKDTFHRVTSTGTTWVLSFRGAWDDLWQEYIPATDESVLLTHGRHEIARGSVRITSVAHAEDAAEIAAAKLKRIMRPKAVQS
jgi:hypothetical protein